MRQFIRGERAKLAELAAINHIWEVEVSIEAPFFIVDFCCLGLDVNGEVVDDHYLISYNQPDAPQDSIRMDNASNNGAIFTLYLEHLPPAVRRLVFTATLHQPEMPGGILGAAFSLFGPTTEIGEGHLRLSTPAVDAGAFTFSGQDFGEESTLILGEFYWRDEWRFVAAGQPLKGELSAFLQTLTNGPTPVPAPAPAPLTHTATPPLAAPPRQPRATTPTPKPAPSNPVPSPKPPSAPIPKPVRPTVAVVVPPSPAEPVAQSIASPSTLPPVAVSASASPLFPQSLPPGGKLQDLIDAAAPGSTLTIMRGEYEGPIKINKPLVLEGRDSALWARVGPVVTIAAPNVTLRSLDVEITVSHDAPDATGIALKIEDQTPQLQLDNVRVRGRIGVSGDENGNWVLPSVLNLGQFAARSENEFRFSLSVPTPVQLSSPVEGISLSPTSVEAGEHQITLQVRDIIPDALIVGFVEVRSAVLVHTIALSGSATAGIAPRKDVQL